MAKKKSIRIDFIYKSTENPIRRNNNIPCYVVGWG